MSQWPDPRDYESFKDFNAAWHHAYKLHNPTWEQQGMYTNGQFDDIPYAEWEKAGGTFDD